MQSKSSTPTVLIVLLIVFTFPLWIGIAAGIFGLIAGLFGAVIGIFGAAFGAIFGVIGGIFGWLFNWHWPYHGFIHWNFFIVILIATVVVLISRSRKI